MVRSLENLHAQSDEQGQAEHEMSHHPHLTTNTNVTPNPQKRRADSPTDGPPSNGPTSTSHKRRFILKDNNTDPSIKKEAQTPLDILALAASTSSRLPEPSNKKRKPILQKTPTPDHETKQKRFNLLTALVSHMDILLNVTSHLQPQTLLNLYSISAPFHYLMDSHFTAFIMAGTRTWAPDADRYYPWWCYRQLCIEDPALRRARTDRRSVSWDDFIPSDDSSSSSSSSPGKRRISSTENTNDGEDDGNQVSSSRPKARVPDPAQEGMIRFEKTRDETTSTSTAPVPSFRWLKMVAYRESVSREIVGWMLAHGHRIPLFDSLDAIKKLWFLIDIPVNGPRISLLHNPTYFPTPTLATLQLLFIKLDMLYTDPLHSHGGESSIREMLLAERSLTTLWNYLRGADGTSNLDILRLWVKHGYVAPAPPLGPMDRVQQEVFDRKAEMSVLGVPPHLVGRWGYECWGLGAKKLLRPDELVLREAVRRRVGLQRMFLPYIAYGYLDEALRPLPTDLKPEDTVLSLIRRKKNREVREKQEDAMDVVKKEEEEEEEEEGEADVLQQQKERVDLLRGLMRAHFDSMQ